MKCDKCNNDATNCVRDIEETTKSLDVWRTYAPFGDIRYGCDVHPVESRGIDLRLSY